MGVLYQVAQKIHARTTPDTDSHVNDRAHDLADLLLLDELGTINPVPIDQDRGVPSVTEARARRGLDTFERRA